MTKVIVTESYLEDIADSIRAKTGSAATLKPSEMSSAIDSISTGTDTSDATLDSNAEMLSGYTAYSNGVKYTGSIPSKSSSDLTASGATVTVPSGYYASNATKSVASGSASAPSTISGTSSTVSVSNNTVTLTKTVSVTPTVTAGYVSSGTATNSSVSLSGSMTTQAAQTLYPSTSDQTVSSGRYLSGTQTFKGVAIANLTAGNIKKGVTVTVGDSADADRITSVTGTYEGSGGGGKNVQGYMGQDYSHTGSLVATDVSLKVAKTGTYKVSWSGFRNTTSGTSQSQLYINGTAYGSAQGTFTSSYGQNVVLSGVSLNENDVVTVYARARNTSYYMYVSNLIIEEQ